MTKISLGVEHVIKLFSSILAKEKLDNFHQDGFWPNTLIKLA
jgi:hypothetical protein